MSKDFFFFTNLQFYDCLCLGGRGLTDLLGEDYYDYYDDYGSGLLSRIRNAVRLVYMLPPEWIFQPNPFRLAQISPAAEWNQG